ncbi:MAG: hypothetical protein ACD_58C00312G0004 [uncultured bacterium]|nr:MAG: hypothetical protein ACD_58C00312G0004 [uncultured bacterium]
MSHILFMKRNSGFTLMELLIVIGVLGILAAGLLAAIDPFEQLKKARDSNYRSAALELLGATQRYYANHGYFPWTDSGTCQAAVNGTTAATEILVPNAVSSSSARALALGGGQGMGEFQPCLDNNLVGDGELKSTFAQGLATTVYLSTWGKTNVRVCYSPEGKSNRADTSTNLHVTGSDASMLIASGCSIEQRNAGDCVQCFQ